MGLRQAHKSMTIDRQSVRRDAGHAGSDDGAERPVGAAAKASPAREAELVLDPAGRALVEAPGNQALLAVYRYWDGLRTHPAEIPARARFDPIDIPRLLGRVFLAEVVAGPSWRVRYRLIGSQIVGIEGRDHTGRFLDEINPDPDSPMRRHYAELIDRRRIYVRNDTAYWAGRDHVAYRALLLPLSSGDGKLSHILGVMTWEN